MDNQGALLRMLLWEPELMRQACLRGDGMGSGMGRPGFNFVLCHLVAAYTWAIHLKSVSPHFLIWRKGLTLPAPLGG